MSTQAKLGVVAALGAVTLLAAAPANAQVTQEEGGRFLERPVAAPSNAFELSIAPGYSQPFGNIARGTDLRDIAGPGVGVNGTMGYRFDPHWMVGFTGGYSAYGTGEARAAPALPATARAVTVGLEGVFHALPYHPVDPFISIGAGWRGMWERHDGVVTDVFRQGLSAARVGLGIDIRLSRDFAIAPLVMGDANIFLWQDRGTAIGTTAIPEPRVNFFLSAGLQGRFDIGGDRIEESGAAVSTTTTTSGRPVLVEEVPR